MATAKISKAEARKAYTQNVLERIVIFDTFASVPSESNSDTYRVRIEDGRSVSCECKDCYYRKSYCKHQEAVQAKLDATLPLLNTLDAKDLITDLAQVFKTKKVRRSARRDDVVASLQVAEGVKIRMRKSVLVVKQVVAPVVEEEAVEKMAA